MATSRKVMTPEYRGSFVYLLKAKPADEEGKKPRYTNVMLFKKGTDLSELSKILKEAAIAEWGEAEVEKLTKAKKLKLPFKDQGDCTNAEGELYAGYEPGNMCAEAWSIDRPGVVDTNVQDIIEEREIYSGAWFRATVHAFTWDNPKKGKGVSFGLQNVQKLRDDERLGGASRTKPQNDFEPVEGASNDDGSAATADALFG